MRSIKLLTWEKMETQMGNGTGVSKPGRAGESQHGPVLKPELPLQGTRELDHLTATPPAGPPW